MFTTTSLVTTTDIEAYSQDGAVCLRGVFDADWVELLGHGMDKALRAPSARSRLWNRDERGGTTFFDAQVWQDNAEYRRFIESSPLAEIAGNLMQSASVNFFFDSVFVRSEGVQFRTPFHQDEPYWSVAGFDTCSAWMPLDPVAKRSSLEFVRGSHRWEQRFTQQNFGELTGDSRDQRVEAVDGRVRFPDIEGCRDDFDILSWAMEPGDIAIFNARIIHGGSGLLASDRSLRVFNTQWLGDDARIVHRPEGMDPDHTEVMTSYGLGPGDRVGGPMYPLLWERSAA